MTERKPPGIRFETWIDQQIRQAQERGEFDNLPGRGKPIADLGEHHDELWWVKQLLAREGVSLTPPTLKLRKDVETFRERLASVPTETDVRGLVADLNARIREINRMPVEGPPSTVMPFDVEATVDRWRAARAAAEDPPAAANRTVGQE